MSVTRYLARLFCVGAIVFGATGVSGQSYPNKSIRMVTGSAGGGLDFALRPIAQGLTGSLSQQVIVDNRSGVTAMEAVAKAPPDGYTLLFYGPPLWTGPLLEKLSYDPVRDFSPITLAVSSPNILAVHPSLAAHSVKELIALAKGRPGALNYASGSTGSSNHLGPELFKAMAGVNIVRIPYKGGGPALNAVIAGETQLMFAVPAEVASHIRSGRLRALAATSAKPSALAPGLPTVAAAGLPGFEAILMYGIFAPAGTPATLINRLNQEIVQVLGQANMKEKFFNMGLEIVGSSAEQLAVTIRSETIKWGKVIKDLGIREE